MKGYRSFIIPTALAAIVTFNLIPLFAITPQQPGAPQPADESQASPKARERLRRLREQRDNKTYVVGYSPAVEREMAELAGIEVPRDETKKAKRIREEARRKLAEYEQELRRREKESPGLQYQSRAVLNQIKANAQRAHPGQQLPSTAAGLIPFLPTFDWDDYHVLSEVQDQGKCNSCWAFSTIAAFESNTRIQSRKWMNALIQTDPQTGLGTAKPGGVLHIEYSEKALLDCIGRQKGSCSGGWHGSAFNHLTRFGAIDGKAPALEQGPCEERGNGRKGLTWDYVNYPPDKIPSVQQMKTALLEHGPLVVLVHVDDGFLVYKSGVFNERKSRTVNHAVLLTGWDDAKRAWRIQNSWGKEWGEGGFMWIEWESNNIGQYAAWVEVPSLFILPTGRRENIK